jgi:hypothetical protein
MRIVASWFGSNGSTEYKDVAAGFFTTTVNLKAGSHLVSLCCSKSSDRPPPPDSWGSIGVGRSPPNRQYEWHEKSGTKKGSTMIST